MMEICGLLASREHEKNEARGRITANWHDRLSCAQRRAKIKHLNYCRVHSIRKQDVGVLKFTWLSQNHLHKTSLFTVPMSDEMT